MFEGNEDLKKNIDAAWRLVTRRRWLLLLTASFVILGTTGVSFLLPNQYISEATIIVEQQQIPERYVTPTSTSDLSSALQAMEQDVLSRAQLQKIIDELGLYQKRRSNSNMDELVAAMRGNIEIKPLEGDDPERRQVNSFRISFTGDSGLEAQQVTSRLTSLFRDENLKTREQQAEGTTNFLGGRLAEAQNDLQKQEERLKDFKLQNLGELPEQEQGNLAILSGLQMQLQGTNGAIARAQEQRTYLTSLLNQYRDLASAGASVTSQAHLPTPMESVQVELVRLRTQRAQLLDRDLPQHPDVVSVDQQIAQATALLDQLQKAQAASAKDDATPAQTAVATGDPVTAQTKSQLESNALEIQNLSQDTKRLASEIETYQKRLNLTPERELQLNAVLNDYNQAKQNYQDLLGKKTQSELATSLEQQQQGQQFRIVDPPTLPSKPTSPNRLKISMGGVVAGLGLAAGLAILIEFKKSCFYTESEIKKRFQVPLIIGVPELRSAEEIRKNTRWKIAEWAGGSALTLFVLIIELFVCLRG